MHPCPLIFPPFIILVVFYKHLSILSLPYCLIFQFVSCYPYAVLCCHGFFSFMVSRFTICSLLPFISPSPILFRSHFSSRFCSAPFPPPPASLLSFCCCCYLPPFSESLRLRFSLCLFFLFSFFPSSLLQTPLPVSSQQLNTFGRLSSPYPSSPTPAH